MMHLHLRPLQIAPMPPSPAFVSLPPSLRTLPSSRRRPLRSSRPPLACASSPSLYQVLGLPHSDDPRSWTTSQIRHAYLQKAKVLHPDISPHPSPDPSSPTFDQVSRAWQILGDNSLRKLYDDAGQAAVDAVQSLRDRSQRLSDRFPGLDGPQLDFLSDTGQLVGALLSPANDSLQLDEEAPPDREDACPRSVDEALYNLRNSSDLSVVYYTLWWIYRFKVSEAQDDLLHVLLTSPKTSSGAFALRRRAALALGAVAQPPIDGNTKVVDALEQAFRTDDYFLRYRVAEALANIAYRAVRVVSSGQQVSFPARVVDTLVDALRRGREAMTARVDAKDGFSTQESLFDLDAVSPEVRKKLEIVFAERRANEARSRRTTMTPQLGVSRVGSASDDEPYEWIIKAVAAIDSFVPNQVSISDHVDVISAFTDHDIPLVRFAARKALFSLTGDAWHAEAIVDALQFGREHHYSQRVLIRDLGDVGYWQGAEAVANCPMVENSFKILALKNMLAKLDYDSNKSEVRQVLSHMDSLL